MSKANLITGLDIGTQSIKILVSEKKSEGKLEAISQIRESSMELEKE